MKISGFPAPLELPVRGLRAQIKKEKDVLSEDAIIFDPEDRSKNGQGSEEKEPPPSKDQTEERPERKGNSTALNIVV